MLPHRLLNYSSGSVTRSTFEPSFYRPPPPPVLNLDSASSNSRKASLPTPRPSLDLNTTPSSVGQKKIDSPQDPSNYNDHAAASLPTPRSSSDSVRQPHFLSFDQVVCRLKPLLDGRDRKAGERKISIEGVSADIIDKLRAKSSELPGWENLRIDFSADKLIVHYPTLGHEIMASLFFNVDINDANGRSLFSLDAGVVRLGGSGDVELEDGIKSPDFSLYDNTRTKRPGTRVRPTVVWEVAYSEDEKKLAHDLARYVACSRGRVRLAIGVKIERTRAVAGRPQGLKKVTCVFWEADYVETFATLEESGARLLNHLTRCDEYADDADDYVVPAATKFSCVSQSKGKFEKFVVSEHASYTIFPEGQNGFTEMNILNRHLYRASKAEDQDKPAITIPFSILRRVILAHEEQQSLLELSRDIEKRRHDEGDLYDGSDEDSDGEIDRLKRRRVEGA